MQKEKIASGISIREIYKLRSLCTRLLTPCIIDDAEKNNKFFETRKKIPNTDYLIWSHKEYSLLSNHNSKKAEYVKQKKKYFQQSFVNLITARGEEVEPLFDRFIYYFGGRGEWVSNSKFSGTCG